MPSRTTRRKAHAQSELLAHVVAPVAKRPAFAPSAKGKERVFEELPAKTKGKGKAVAEQSLIASPVEDALHAKGKRKASDVSADMLPPPIPDKRSKGSRRATMIASVPELVPNEEAGLDLQASGGDKAKRRGRISLPDFSSSKKIRTVKKADPVSRESASPLIGTPASERLPSPSPIPTRTYLPTLAHLPFPPAPHRTKKRIVGPRTIRYTDPSQRPPAPKYGGDIASIMESYVNINDTGPPPEIKTLEARAKKEGYLLARVMYLKSHGRLQRLVDEENGSNLLPTTTTSNSHAKIIRIPPRKTDFHDSLMAHMVQVRNAMLNVAKAKPVTCKRVAKMVQAYWENIEGKEERERLAEEKERKRMTKEIVKSLRKRWALAVKVGHPNAPVKIGC